MQMRRRRRTAGLRAKKKFVALMIVLALVAAAAVWTAIIVERRREAVMFDATLPAPALASAFSSDKRKNLIFFLGTGFGLVPMTAARIYAVGEDKELAIDKLPETAFVKTWSNDAQAADSAAAMSAYMTGLKVDSGVISSTSDTRAFDAQSNPHARHGDSDCAATGNGGAATTLLELAKAAGRGTGVVTTARVTDAAVAATYAHLCHRDGQNAIAAQLTPGGAGYNARLGDGVDVILGGGWNHFLPKGDARGSIRDDARDLIAEMKATGYTVVATQAELMAATASTARLFGLFNKSDMNFDVDRIGTLEPSLAQMTTRAIDVLQKNPNGYFLVIEGGRIDHALRAGQARKALQDAKAFDDALGTAIAKAKILDPELRNTLIVVTADHDSTLVMNGYSGLAGKTSETNAGVLGLMRDYNDPSQPALDADGRPFTTLVFGSGARRVNGSRAALPVLRDAIVVDKEYRLEAAVETGETRGGADVFLGALGMNANQFHGVIENTKVFALMKNAIGL